MFAFGFVFDQCVERRRKGRKAEVEKERAEGRGEEEGRPSPTLSPKTNKRLMLHKGEACLPRLQEKSVGPRGEPAPQVLDSIGSFSRRCGGDPQC